MDQEQLSPEEAQEVWNQEAAKLDAGDSSPAIDSSAAAPETPPQIETESEPQAQAAEQPQQPEQAEDPLAGIPEVVRAKLAEIDQLKHANAQLLHHVRTAEGRVAAMQREFQQAKVAQQVVAPQQAPTQGQIATAVKSPEKWEQLKQDFPEWGSAVEEFVTSKLGAVQPAQPNLDPKLVEAYVQQQVAATKAEMQLALEEARVEGKYDDWKTTVASPDFLQWFALQPAEVRALAESTSSRDAIRMLDMFSESKKRTATDIKQERGARLAAAATVRPGQTPPPKTLDDMSPSELWNYEAAKRDKERASRGY